MGRPKKGSVQEHNIAVLQKQIAALASLGATDATIAKELNVHRQTVADILAKESTKELIEEIGNDAMRAAKAQLRRGVSKLGPLIIEALTYQLQEKYSVQAAALGLRVMGLDSPEENVGSQSVTVILPGTLGKQDESITIKPMKIEND